MSDDNNGWVSDAARLAAIADTIAFRHLLDALKAQAVAGTVGALAIDGKALAAKIDAATKPAVKPAAVKA